MKFLSVPAAVLSMVMSFSALHAQSDTARTNPAEEYLQAEADRERAAFGLPPLRRDAGLVSAARIHALQMVDHGSISHQFAGEPDLAARASSTGARFSLISENVAQAPSASRIHAAWMHSEGHRHNLLDANVDAVGIAVIARGRQLFAVEDFERSAPALTMKQQVNATLKALLGAGIPAEGSTDSGLSACRSMDLPVKRGKPLFVMRYTTADLSVLPDRLRTEWASGRYGRAEVVVCPPENGSAFSMYSLAVLLYREPIRAD